MHTLTIQATSVFDAADRAMQEWCRFWWYEPDALVKVQCSEERWNVCA